MSSMNKFSFHLIKKSMVYLENLEQIIFLKYSILMSVYKKENPAYLKSSIDSMLCQTRPPDDFVIICDGALTPALDRVLDTYKLRYPDLMQIIRLPVNRGIGNAANEGLAFCRHNLIAKMDSDDISVPDRCEKQLIFFQNNPQLDIVGGQLAEFYHDISNITAYRRVPIEHQNIIDYAKKRSPFNNQTVMFKKSSVLLAGGYSMLRRCEDYELYIRMLLQGCLTANCGEVLVYYRMTKNTLKRRGSQENLKCFFYVHMTAYKKGFCCLSDVVIPCLGQVLITITPCRIRGWLYRLILRR